MPLVYLSSQHQTMRSHGREVAAIACSQLRLESDGYGSNAAVGISLGTPTREIEKHRRFFGIGTIKWLGNRQQLACKSFRRLRKRPAEKLAPGESAHPYRLTGTQPADHLSFLRTAGNERINEEIGIEVNHGLCSCERLPSSIHDRLFPFCGVVCGQGHLRLQLTERL